MKKTFVIFAFLLFFGLSLTADIPANERAALIDLYNATDGDHWINNFGWKTPPLYTDGFAMPGTENTWHGVTTDAGNTNVVSLWLNDNNLAGNLPAGLGNLSSLQWLDLQYNQLTGSIQPELGNLSKLQELRLTANQLTGYIPSELGNLTALVYLYLNGNQLESGIPIEFAYLTELQVLDLSYNNLSGAIIPELYTLKNLVSLRLHNNRLSGSIRVDIGELSNLQELWLCSNKLTGIIPKELGELTSMQTLFLDFNQISGMIPAELGKMSKLWNLHLDFNRLYGTIPTELGNLSELWDFYLSGNNLSGEIPVSLSNLTQLDPTATAFGYNALHTSDVGLIDFLNQKDSDWAATQTIAPTNLKATVQNASSVLLTWTPPPYTADGGGYYIYYSKDLAGPWVLNSMGPATKTATSQSVGGLDANTLYYFKVNTFTDRHGQNQNWVVSEDSEIVTATTLRETQAWKAGIRYIVGDLVIYKNQTWHCTFAHTAQSNWYPGAAGIWFWTIADHDGQWHAGCWYRVGDVVRYQGRYWQCTFAHTSQSGWYPGAPGIWFWKRI